ncbi:TIGR02234 family membrane protein [Streptosporangium lutulentum]|uniref:Membrane protein (TIGR02234 family) n=1 Tax=Streptosporangium lutulentum TaxID=1461250 RepID=A0ABT9QEF7_9ACTN|nr:TIGR02234 family membrane protein [Streptosporangium lutulentum]MDP9845054.1 putative membrane protein (TIGR02234 family) [Streptosporangium lutulentum]
MTARRALWTWVVVCVAGAALVLLTAGRNWFTVTYGTRNVAVSAAELAPVLGPAAWAALAAVVAVLATRGVWRRLIGGVMALCGAGVIAAAWWGSGTGEALRIAADRAPMVGGGTPQVASVVAWPLLAAAGGLLLLAGGVTAALRGGRWPGMSDRYDRPGSRAEGAGGTLDQSAPSERALWDAIDHGVDPTAESENAEPKNGEQR